MKRPVLELGPKMCSVYLETSNRSKEKKTLKNEYF